MALTAEYETLREEMLQLYGEQSQLAFVTGISSAAILFGLLQTQIPVGIGVLVWHLTLVGIAWKLTANYKRIYRIGSYLQVVHEQESQQNSVPSHKQLAWHYRTRLIGKRPLPASGYIIDSKFRARLFGLLFPPRWRWASGCSIDARFLRVLGLGGTLFVILSGFDWSIWPPKFEVSVVWVIVAILGFLYLCYHTYYLSISKEITKWFEDELWRLLAENSSVSE